MSGIIDSVGSRSGIIGKTEQHNDGFTPINVGNVDKPGLGPYAVDKWTRVLIHSDTTDGDDYFIDSATGNSIRSNGAEHKTTQKKMGKTSIRFEGSDTLVVMNPHNIYLAAYGNFTIDCWIWMDNATASNQALAQMHYSDQNSFAWGIDGSNMQMQEDRDNTIFDAAHGMSNDTWYHVALCAYEDGTEWRGYVNGVLKATSSSSYNLINSGSASNETPFRIGPIDNDFGSGTSGNFVGYVDEYRISWGIARWPTTENVGTTVFNVH